MEQEPPRCDLPAPKASGIGDGAQRGHGTRAAGVTVSGGRAAQTGWGAGCQAVISVTGKLVFWCNFPPVISLSVIFRLCVML